MTGSEVSKLEKEINLQFSPFHREVLKDPYPFFYIECFSYEEILSQYNAYISEGFKGEFWHKNFLPIGRNGRGIGIYFVDLSDSEPWLYLTEAEGRHTYKSDSYERCQCALLSVELP